MITITPESIAKAVERALAPENRNFARRVAHSTYIVECPRGHEHLVTFDGNTAACDCEAGQIGKHACHHIAAALALHDGIDRMRAEADRRQLRADRDGRAEIAAMFDGQLPQGRGFDDETSVLVHTPPRKTVERVGAFTI